MDGWFGVSGDGSVVGLAGVVSFWVRQTQLQGFCRLALRLSL